VDPLRKKSIMGHMNFIHLALLLFASASAIPLRTSFLLQIKQEKETVLFLPTDPHTTLPRLLATSF
jgi:hypothetical protein